MNDAYIGPGSVQSEASNTAAMSWVIKRFLPVLLLTAGAAVGLAFLRASQVFLIGLQGMFAGGILGWIAGRLGRKDPGAFWSFSQRCWLGVSMMVVYVATHLVSLSMFNAGPVDTPLYWLGEVVQGFQKEGFASAGRFQAYQGTIEGGWWIVMTVVDAGLFWFLFIALCVVGVCSDQKANGNTASDVNESSTVNEVDSVEEPDENGVMVPPSSRTAFFAALFVLTGLVVAGGLYWQFTYGPQPEMTFSSGLVAMQRYGGQWRFKEG